MSFSVGVCLSEIPCTLGGLGALQVQESWSLLNGSWRDPWSTATHLIGAILALVATLDLLRLTAGRLDRQIAMLVYGMGMMASLSASAVYHALPVDDVHLYQRLDHCAIFLLVAGTNTPFHHVLSPGWPGRCINAMIWLLALAGMALKWWGPPLPYGVSVAIYAGLGLVGMAGYQSAKRRLPPSALLWVWAGGYLYISGAVLDALNWPALEPGIWSSHETFHVCVLGGAACFYIFMRTYVAGYDATNQPVMDAFPHEASKPEEHTSPSLTLDESNISVSADT